MINFSSILPHELIQLGGIILLFWVIAGLIFNLLRWRPVISSLRSGNNNALDFHSLSRIFKVIISEVLLQSKLWRCSTMKWFSHFTVFGGFIGLSISTTLNYLMNPEAQSLPFSHPVRIIGNISGIFLILGLTLIFREKLITQSSEQKYSFSTLWFIGLLYISGVSGFFTEIFSEINSPLWTSFSYWIHLISVATLILFAPFSKFLHSFGRSIILILENLEDPKEII
jgi:hypothetical protein